MLKVSVCIQTYNHEKYIRECLDSILNQKTDFDFEILLGEDDSSDSTRIICKEYFDRFPKRIRLFLHDRENVIYINGKPSGRYNFLNNLEKSEGEYIALCDGDDYWVDELKLQKQIDFLESNKEFSICYSQVNLVDTNSSFVETSNVDSLDEATYETLLKGNFINTPSVVIRNDSIPKPLPKWFKTMPMGDWPILLFASQKGRIKLIREPLAAYRTHNSGIWSVNTTFEKLKIGFQSRKILYQHLSNESKAIILESLIGNTLYMSSKYREEKEYYNSIKYYALFVYYRISRIFQKV